MKKIIFLIFISCASFLQAEDVNKESFGYINIGVKGYAPLIFPTSGIGYHYQNNYHGFDISVQETPIMTVLSISPMYKYFWKPNLKKEAYIGLGIDFGIISNSHLALTPVLAFGSKYQNKNESNRFFQFELGPCTLQTERMKIFPWPTIGFQYGWGF